MPKLSRALTAAAGLLLALALALPVWRIDLIAPQYPEGLGMQIRLATVQGLKEHDLQNINELNHYIGMKLIDPGAMPELRYMPWIVVGLAAAALAVALAGRRKLLYGYLGVFGAAAAAGMWDFWRWTYDYGHNLDIEHAIIKVPGMVYQPPLIGTKQILNFTASSWPAAGGIAIGLAFVLATGAAYVLRPRRPAALVVPLPAHGPASHSRLPAA